MSETGSHAEEAHRQVARDCARNVCEESMSNERGVEGCTVEIEF
jgi:hypothetical protein